ncbi:MAG: phosphoethanolamine transferase [Prevotella sp.]|uniref:phosphoethanolamine transferase n=1 Tax=Prevotella sp. TaxID=59823 RepID=UPI002A25107F|nr:phosphoethanolamine transferase [Prevotella sp.]MDD7317743.1 phosphoethanolamine transferase [Prevotellaceae bacterium]MDY4020658.1 phosphoethanolamine transferase [Prevotella sp.]
MLRILRVITRVLGAVTIPIRKNFVFFVMMYVLGAVCVYAVLPERRGARVFEFWWQELLVDVYLICALLAALPGKIRRWVRMVFGIVAYTVAVVDVYCFVKFDSTLTPTMLLLVGETTGGEAAEFLRSYIHPSVIFSRLGRVLLVLAAHVAAVGLLYVFRERVRKVLRRWQIVWRGMNIRRSPWVGIYPLMSLSIIVLLLYSLASCLENKRAEHRLMTFENIGDVEHELTEKTCANLHQPLYRLIFSIYANRLASQQVTKLINGIDKATVDSCSFASPNIVLVIGESYNRHHSQLYGYEKNTTPRQVERERRGELIKMSDAVTPWNLTSYVFKHLFSMYAVGDNGDWCDYPLFPELFRRAGYHVTFITNQYLPKAKEAVYDFSGGFFLNNETLSRAMFDTRNSRLHAFDDGVISEYDNLRKADKEHNLIILHLMGQHVKYASRVPEKRKHFRKEDYQRKGFSAKERQVMADYDNALLYNDSIMDEVLKRFEDKDAVVIYVPDHGEECYGGNVHFFGRMHSTDITARLAHEEFDIPMWFWCSRRFREAHPETVKAIKTAAGKRYMTDALPHSLLSLAGIHTRWYRSGLDVLSEDYDEKRPRLLKNTADYDKLRAGSGKQVR